MLKVEDMHVYYGAIHAIKGVSFEVGEGEIVALIGANGAGKSTILKTVSGLMHPRSGNITFCGEDIAHMEAYKLLRHGLAHVPEGRRIFLQMTVQENLILIHAGGEAAFRYAMEMILSTSDRSMLPLGTIVYTSFRNTNGPSFAEGYGFGSYITAFKNLGLSILFWMQRSIRVIRL